MLSPPIRLNSNHDPPQYQPLLVVPVFLGSDIVPPAQRGPVNALLSLSWGGGTMLGGYFGGVLNDIFGWRAAFLVQVPLALVIAILIATLVRIPPKQSRSGKSYLARIDFVGAGLVVSGLVLFQGPLNAGGVITPWSNPLIWLSMALSAIVFALLVAWELGVKYPMVPVSLLANGTVLAAAVGGMLSTYVFLVMTFYVPLFFQVFGLSATEAGTRLLVAAIGTVSGGPLGGLLISRIGYRAVGVMFGSVATGSCIILCFVDDHTPTVRPYTLQRAFSLHLFPRLPN